MMDMDVEKVRLLRCDGEARSPHRLPRRLCRVSAAAKKRLKMVFYATFVASSLAAVLAVLPIKAVLAAVGAWIDLHPWWGALIMPAMFGVAVPLAIPSTMLEILSGSVFGLVRGALLNAAGKTCGAIVAFLVGKRLGKERLGSYLQTKFPMFSALTSVVEGPNWKPLVLIQLSSIPPVIKCYGLSITDISLVRFTVTSLVGGFPNAVLWAYIGYQTKDVIRNSDGGDANVPSYSAGSRWAMLLIGLACTVLAMGFLFVYTRRELRAQLQLAKKDHKIRSSSDGEDGDTESEGTLLLSDEDDAYAVVVTQVAVLDSEQQVAKRTSIV